MSEDPKQIVAEAKDKFSVILKELPGNEEEVLIAPYPLVKESPVRSYRKVRYDDFEVVENTGEVWETSGRRFPVVRIRVLPEKSVPLSEVVANMYDEKIVEPRTRDTLKLSWNAVLPSAAAGGIYVMGSCESCWCDNVWC